MGKPDYNKVWDRASAAWQRFTIRPSRQWEFDAVAQRLCAAKQRYLAVEKYTGVPWYVIAVIHEREASQSWRGNLANGDPWNSITTHVPRGRGPFKSWEDAAIDALIYDGLNREHNWCIEHTLYLLEAYNGWGYWNHGVASAYVWAGTTEYQSGKYIADGVWDPNAVDKQLGCAGLLRTMARLDPSIQLFRQGDPAKHVLPEPQPPDVHPAPGPVAPRDPLPVRPTWWEWFLKLILKKE